jgi:hypothetical protein
MQRPQELTILMPHARCQDRIPRQPLVTKQYTAAAHSEIWVLVRRTLKSLRPSLPSFLSSASHSHQAVPFKVPLPIMSSESLGSRHTHVTGRDVDLMHGSEGEEVVDNTYDVNVTPRASFACVLHPSELGNAYFFCANRYVLVNGAPASTADIVKGPEAIARGWPSLIVDAGFSQVDAVLPIPGNPSEMYFFCGRRYTCLSSVQNGRCSSFYVRSHLF